MFGCHPATEKLAFYTQIRKVLISRKVEISGYSSGDQSLSPAIVKGELIKEMRVRPMADDFICPVGINELDMVLKVRNEVA